MHNLINKKVEVKYQYLENGYDSYNYRIIYKHYSINVYIPLSKTRYWFKDAIRYFFYKE